MKSLRHIILASALLILLPLGAGAQNHIRRAMDRARERQAEMARRQVQADGIEGARGYLRMQVENGDTTYLDKLPPIYIIGRGKARSEKQWRAYYKLVWRFARVYPYAQASGHLIKQVDSTLNAEHYRGLRKERYIDAIQKQIFRDFEKPLRNMSIQQGALLLKLINRETGLPPYTIIKDYKNRMAAGFWEGVAHLFDNSLKTAYDPTGADATIEELVQIWNAGEFPALYWSIFWEDPPKVEVPESYLE
ncbi:MAG: DUF4294 domain-containing protein [Bacteroidales bacterium]|nr:DUF4294 domain-containing protein [Bacteroidales bacterium]MBR1783773.1 DUF4294 domain-containing protein [Bacteroidales bacterium]